jgi:ABC-type multidrug transport system fused ATPase/permease subunit
MSFFDTTPLGRIVNRFSKDVYSLDESIPQAFFSFFRTFVAVSSILVVIVSTTPLFGILIIPIAFIYYFVARYYLATSRELKRLDSVTKSPIYAHFSETLNGVSTIRAYGKVSEFEELNERKLDTNQRAYYPSISSNRWLAIRLEFLGSLIIFGASLFSVISVLYFKSINAAVVGLSVSYALQVTQTLNWMMRMAADVETNIVAVERIKEYIELPSEAPSRIEENAPGVNWPGSGAIEFYRYSCRYRPGLDLVLKSVNVSIKAGEKVGIVGRSGAGKSSLMLGLFRIVEPAEGTILIDGVDITKIGLDDLRSRITIIPQDSVLFGGSLRENLDPDGNCSDLELWSALRSSHLEKTVEILPGKLDAVIAQNGENFSVGQRQLICLARALLRKSKVLVLDEATAAIDIQTDALIQETIRKEFKACTVLTIAHRINTVMDSDKILVMDKGRVAEFDSPRNLLLSPESIFRGLASEAGVLPGK